LMDHSIAENYTKGFLDREEAVVRSTNPGKMDKLLAPDGQLAAAAR
jgi:hypothetical protein